MQKKLVTAFAVLALVFVLFSCTSAKNDSGHSNSEIPEASDAQPLKDLSGYHKAYFAAGCFWCVEAVFESVEGVEEAVSGYSGGTKANPTYREVSSGTLRHAEAVMVYYDSSKVDFPTLLKVFFGSQDPTTPNRQGPDRGPQYRSIAFYQNAAEKQMIKEYIAELDASGEFDAPIVTEVTAFEKFWPAEDYHQNYERLNPNQPYVKSVSVPRLNRFKKKYPELLKSEH